MATNIRVGAVAPIGLPPVDIREWSDHVGSLNLEHLVVTDHVLGVDTRHQEEGWDRYFPHAAGEQAYSETTPFNEPLVTLGYLAAISQLELVTGVLVLPQRNTAVVAKQAAQIDLLCGGKLRLGVSIGWNRVEFAALGAEFATRGKRFTEQINLLRKYWTEELVFFDGDFHQAHGVALEPRPIQRPIPLWLGGASPEHGPPNPHLLERIARLGDGWYLDAGVAPTETTATAITDLRRMVEDHGRVAEDFGIDARINLARVPRDDVAEVARRWRRLGVSHLTIDTRDAQKAGWPSPFESHEAMTRAAQLVVDEVAS